MLRDGEFARHVPGCRRLGGGDPASDHRPVGRPRLPGQGRAGQTASPLLVATRHLRVSAAGRRPRGRPGEIVGLAGVEGNGQRDFLRAPRRPDRRSRDESRSSGEPRGDLAIPSRRRRRHRLPARRPPRGGRVALALASARTLAARARSHGAFRARLARPRTRAGGAEVARLRSRRRPHETAISALSGGNQQKVLFARSLLANPAVFLADEPTRGVDAGARIELYQVCARAAKAGRRSSCYRQTPSSCRGCATGCSCSRAARWCGRSTGDEITEENITGAAIRSDGPAARGRGANGGQAAAVRGVSSPATIAPMRGAPAADRGARASTRPASTADS